VVDRIDAAITRRDVLQLIGLGVGGAVVAACVPTGTAPTPSAAQATAGASPSVGPSATPVVTPVPQGEIVIWDRAGDLFQVAESAIPAFNRKYPDITVKHEAIETSKLAPTLTTGVGVPDGAFIEDDGLGPILEHLHDLTDWIQPYVSDLVPYKVRAASRDGRIVGIPYDVDPGLLYYREDILSKHGMSIDTIATYDDLIAAARELKAKDPNLKPIRVENVPILIVLWTGMFANQQGGSYIDASGELTIENDLFLRVLKFYKQVVDEGLASRVDVFSPGDIAANDRDLQVFVPYAIWYNYGIGSLFKESKGKFRAAELPAWEPGGGRAASMGGSSFIIPAKATNPELAWLYYEFMMFSEEGYKAYYGPSKIYPNGIDTLLPAYLPAYGTALMKPPASLGGQDLWALATDVAAQIPDTYYYPTWFGQMADIFGANVQRLYDGKMSPEEVLQKSAADIRSKLMR